MKYCWKFLLISFSFCSLLSPIFWKKSVPFWRAASHLYLAVLHQWPCKLLQYTIQSIMLQITREWFIFYFFHTFVTCCGRITGNKSPATSDWFQIVQNTSSVCYYHVQSCITLSKPLMEGGFDWRSMQNGWVVH